jgi:hypothetical protein
MQESNRQEQTVQFARLVHPDERLGFEHERISRMQQQARAAKQHKLFVSPGGSQDERFEERTGIFMNREAIYE